MTIRKLVVSACLSLLATVGPAAAGDSGLIRIEPRLFYGASVTMEQGVRVWRALPPTRHMIINPTNAPVNLNVTDVRERITHNHNYGHTAQAATNGYAGGGGYYAAPGYFAGRRFAGHRFAGPRFAGHRPNRAVGYSPFRGHSRPYGHGPRR